MTRDWLPPEPPRGHPGWAVASLVVHAVAVAVLLAMSGKVVRDPSVSYIVLEPAVGPVVYYDMPYVRGGGGGEGAAVGTGTGRATAPAPPRGAEQTGDGVSVPRLADSVIPSAPPGEGIGIGAGNRKLGAQLGDGRVWVRPWDAIAAAIAGAGDGQDSVDARTHVARIDSAITARIMAFLDTLPLDSMATPVAQPWVTEIGGQKWGIDEGWIYLGNLKLPSAILALLPLPQGNYEQAQRAAEIQRIRADIIQAARRAESTADFKRYVEETRKRRDAEREARRSQQQAKPDSISG